MFTKVGFTRDSALVTATFVSAITLYLGAQFDVMQTSFGLDPVWESRIQFVAGISGFIAGWLRMSPLGLSSANAMATAKHDQTLAPHRTEPT